MPIVTHLIADTYGTFIQKHQGRLRLTKGQEVLAQAPLLHLESVTIANSGVGLSAEAIRACAEGGIPIHFLSSGGAPYAALYSAGLAGTVVTRRAQLEAYGDLRGVRIALGVTGGKIENQSRLIKYAAKNRKESDEATHHELRLLAGEVIDHMEELCTLDFIAAREAYTLVEARPQILSTEGRAAQKYWRAVGLLLPPALGWPGRRRRGATDPFNSALNYGYGILYHQVQQAIVLAGLDPYAGFLHVDRPGKPSLVLDLIEEFRAPVVDRTVLGLATRNVPFELDDAGRLTEAARRQLAQHVIDRLDSAERHDGQRRPLRDIIQTQARRVAAFLRGERDGYQPFLAGW